MPIKFRFYKYINVFGKGKSLKSGIDVLTYIKSTDGLCLHRYKYVYIYTHTHKSINACVAVIYLPLYFQLFEAFIKICCPPAERDLVTYKYVWWHLALLKAAPLATIPRSERRSQVDFSALRRQASWGISPQTSYHRTCSLAHWWWVRAERLCAAFINKTSSLVLAFRCCVAAVKKKKWASSILSSVCCAEIHLINYRLKDWNNIQEGQRP